MFVCPNCRIENRETAKFCRRCGRARDEANAEPQAEPKSSTAQTKNDTPRQEAPPHIEEPSPPEMSQLMTAGSSQCPSCFSAVRSSDRFCCWCGQEQPARLLPYFKVCLDCSTHLPEKANFCFSCGTDVSHQSRRKVTVPYELFQEEDSELFPRFEV